MAVIRKYNRLNVNCGYQDFQKAHLWQELFFVKIRLEVYIAVY